MTTTERTELIKNEYGDIMGEKGKEAFRLILATLTEELELDERKVWSVLLLGWCKFMLPSRPDCLANAADGIWGKVIAEENVVAEKRAENGIYRAQCYLREQGFPTTMREADVLKMDSVKLAEIVLGEKMYLDCGEQKLFQEDIQSILELTRC